MWTNATYFIEFMQLFISNQSLNKKYLLCIFLKFEAGASEFLENLESYIFSILYICLLHTCDLYYMHMLYLIKIMFYIVYGFIFILDLWLLWIRDERKVAFQIRKSHGCTAALTASTRNVADGNWKKGAKFCSYVCKLFAGYFSALTFIFMIFLDRYLTR